MDGVAQGVLPVNVRDGDDVFGAARDLFAVGPDLGDGEGGEVGEEDDVGEAAGGERADPGGEAHVAGGIESDHLDGDLGGEAGGDGETDVVVGGAVAEGVVGGAVVGGER
jgi:hypothetical protein